MIVFRRLGLVCLLATGAAHAKGFTSARDLLVKVFKANPAVVLEGRVTTTRPRSKKTGEVPPAEVGSGVLKFRHPTFVAFDFYGDAPFDFRLENGGMTFMRYPKGRGAAGVAFGPSKLEGKIGEWLWSSLVNVNQNPLQDFVMAKLFSTELRYAHGRHRLRFLRQVPGVTLREVSLEFDDVYKAKEFVAVDDDGTRYVFEVQSEKKLP